MHFGVFPILCDMQGISTEEARKQKRKKRKYFYTAKKNCCSEKKAALKNFFSGKIAINGKNNLLSVALGLFSAIHFGVHCLIIFSNM